MRLDEALKNKLGSSREYAKSLILNGAVFVNGKGVSKPAYAVSENDSIEIDETKQLKFVGRGGIKLDAALRAFNLSLNGKCCLDVGASTGGFTDVMLQNEAAKIYAVDVGSSQLSEKLKGNENIVLLENTDIRAANEHIKEKCDFVTVDVSFISITKILHHITALMKENAEAVFLIKPQFEAGRGLVGKSGIVKDKKVHKHILQNIFESLNEHRLGVIGIIKSPIKGKSGNIEYLLYVKRNSISISKQAFMNIVESTL